MKNAKEPGVCIFCGGRPVTAEHLWARWIGALLPKPPDEPDWHLQSMAQLTPLGGRVIEFKPTLKTSRGPIKTRKIRKVCGKRCNGGWMSRLETRAAAAMSKAILGEPCTLEGSDLRAIANWAVLTTIIAEFTDPSTQAVPTSDRAWLMAGWESLTGTVEAELPPLPPHWRVYIGSHSDKDWRLNFNHTAVTASVLGALPARATSAQSTTFGLGHLMVHAVSSAGLPLAEVPQKAALVEIWPSAPQSLALPLVTELNADEMERLSRALILDNFRGLSI